MPIFLQHFSLFFKCKSKLRFVIRFVSFLLKFLYKKKRLKNSVIIRPAIIFMIVSFVNRSEGRQVFNLLIFVSILNFKIRQKLKQTQRFAVYIFFFSTKKFKLTNCLSLYFVFKKSIFLLSKLTLFECMLTELYYNNVNSMESN